MSSVHIPPLLEDARKQCDDAIAEGFESDSPVLIDALPAMGKSSGVIRWAAETGNKVTIFTARHDLYEQYEEWCEDEEIPADKVRILPSFQRECPSAKGDYDDDEKKDEYQLSTKINKWYRKGYSGVEIHNRANHLLGEELPCQDNDCECPYLSNRTFDSEDYDVIIGHYLHSYVPARMEDRYVVFDEFPEDNLLKKFSSQDFTAGVSAFLKENQFPYRHYTDLSDSLVRLQSQRTASKRDSSDPRGDSVRREQANEWFKENNPKLNIDKSKKHIHPYAALFTYSLLNAEVLENGWRYYQLPFSRVSVLNPEDGSFHLLKPPSLKKAKSVIALDGTPTIEKWRLILGKNLEHDRVLDLDERRAYLDEALQLEIIQTTTIAKHNLSGDNISVNKEFALIEAIKQREGETPSLITSYQVLKKYKKNGLDYLIEDVDTKTAHFFEVKGLDEFGTDRLGIIIGSLHKGHEEVQKWAALCGVSVEPAVDEDGNPKEGMETDYGTFGNRIFEGIRENEVLQFIMRFGRTPDEDESGAKVYVYTAAIPDWINPTMDIAEIQPFGGPKNGLYRIISALRAEPYWESETWTVADVHELVNERTIAGENPLSDRQVLKHLKKLKEHGLLHGEQGGQGNAWTFWNANLADSGQFGYVRFQSQSDPDEIEL